MTVTGVPRPLKQMERERTAGRAIEEMLRVVTHTKSGPMQIQKVHIMKMIHSNRSKAAIGNQRGDKIWAWVAEEVEQGRHALRDTSGWEQKWLKASVRAMLMARGRAAWAQSGEEWLKESREAERQEVAGAIRIWIQENEPPAKGPVVMRAPTMRRMLAAKGKLAKIRGGKQALYSALLDLTALKEVVLDELPNAKHNKGPWTTWMEDSAEWMVTRGWVESEKEAEEILKRAKQQDGPKKPWRHVVMDFGEGWGSVGRAIRDKFEGTKVYGVDKRGLTSTGAKHGTITAAINHDFTANESRGLMRGVARKAGVSTRKWTLAWLSLECSPLSIANAINQASGTAHGPWANSVQNTSKAQGVRLEQEQEYLREAFLSLENVIESLEAEPHIKFALENPATSHLWDLPALKEALGRNAETWRLIRVDQCAYGRKSQKPTCILTNLNWIPKGTTGTGRCVTGKCAGTLSNKKGDKRHEEQTVANTPDRRPDQGKKIGSRREHTREAVVNAVEAALVQEIMSAAISVREKKLIKIRIAV